MTFQASLFVSSSAFMNPADKSFGLRAMSCHGTPTMPAKKNQSLGRCGAHRGPLSHAGSLNSGFFAPLPYLSSV
jgi:hypothetical protein